MATILCIDDEIPALSTRKMLLESEGYSVIEAHTGPEGVQLFQSSKPDLVVIDYWMDGMNGVETATRIKKLDSSIPIIILSGFGQLPGETLGIAQRWILKGRPPEELLSAIKDLLSQP